MWVLHNDTPFPVERAGYRDRLGREVFIGVLRASFDIGADGRVKRAERQTTPVLAATWTGEPGHSSMLDDCDCQPKEGTDLVVRGHAQAPGGRPVRSLEVSLRLAQWRKTVVVHGPRLWERASNGSDVVPGLAQRFDKLALEYERAFGGRDPKAPPEQPGYCAGNPVGSGFVHDPASLLGMPAPQVEYPSVALVAGPHQIAPPGFAAIAPHWQPRVGLAGTYDQAWQEERAPLPPDDYHEDFRRCAPQDQQLAGYLRGGELLEVVNMTPDGSLRVELPKLRIHMATRFTDVSERGDAKLQTVTLLPSERRVELTFVARTLCQGREHKLLQARISCPGERSWR